MKKAQMHELLLQSLEVERGGIQVYEAALQCVINKDLENEWTEYLEQTRRHERIMTKLLGELGLEAEESPGRKVLRSIAASLVGAMRMAKQEAEPEAAQLVACECVVLAETKDHLDWELIAELAKNADKATAKALKAASSEVEDEEDEHLYHSTGWCRELWLQSLGLPAVVPPPEEQKDVKTAIGAARAKAQRKELL
jgi:rubrerythrin